MGAELAASMQQSMSGNKIRWGGTADGGRTPKKEEKGGRGYRLRVHTINLHKYV